MERPELPSDLKFAHAGGGDLAVPEEFYATLKIPDHQLLRQIGKGSYGAVWLAHNSLGQYRAAKIVLRQSFKDQRPFDREWTGIQKFEPISRSHEGFVDILHVGIKPGEYFYYIMELGDDESTGQRINPVEYTPKTLGKGIGRQGKLPFDECLQLGIALSQALAELHKHNLVHRDVKPSNIIYVNGIPKLADIGLVADLNEARSYVGTEGFIPPEGPGSAQADVYGLGKVLYEAATGKDRQEFPELPTRLDACEDLTKVLELNEVILKACRSAAKDRYNSAWEMYSELLVLANGKSVKRLRYLETRLAAYKKLARIMAVLVILVAFPSYTFWRERSMAAATRQRQIGVDVANGIQRMNAGDNLGSLPFFARAIALDPAPERSWENRLRFGAAWSASPKLVQFWQHTNEMEFATFDPSGEWVLQITQFGSARVFDVKTGAPVSPPFKRGLGLSHGAFSRDGKYVVTSDQESKSADIWDTQTWSNRLSLAHPTNVFGANFSPDGRRVVTVCSDNIARVWDTATGKRELELKTEGPQPGRGLTSATYSHDQKMIVTTSADNTARIWDSVTGRQMGKPLEHPGWVMCAAFSPDDRSLVTGSQYKVRVWDIGSGKMIPPEMGHEDIVFSVQFSPDGQMILSGSLDSTARLWRTADHSPVNNSPVLLHSDRVTSATFSPDGRQVITTSIDGTVRDFDLAPGADVPAKIRGSFSLNGERFARLGTNGIQVFATATGKPVSGWITAPFPVRGVVLNEGGHFAATVSDSPDSNSTNMLVEVIDADKATPVAKAFSLPSIYTNLTLSHDGNKLLAAGISNAQVWDAAAGLPLGPPILVNQSNISVSADAAFKKVLICNWARAVVFDALTGQQLFAPLTNSGWLAHIGSAEFSPDGSRLAICWQDQMFTRYSALICNAETGLPTCPPLNHGDGVTHVAFSPDGKRVVTASEDKTAMIWDAVTGAMLTPPLKHSIRVISARFNSDGKIVITISDDGNVRLWSAQTGEPLTPPIPHAAKPLDAIFLKDGIHLLTQVSADEGWVTEYPNQLAPLDDLRALVYLLTNEEISTAQHSGGGNNLQRASIWEQMRSKYPAAFVTTPVEVMRWHELEMEKAKALKQTAAVEFHRNYLGALQPTNDGK